MFSSLFFYSVREKLRHRALGLDVIRVSSQSKVPRVKMKTSPVFVPCAQPSEIVYVLVCCHRHRRCCCLWVLLSNQAKSETPELTLCILTATAKMDCHMKESLLRVRVSCGAGYMPQKPYFLIDFAGTPVQIHYQGTDWRRVQMCSFCHRELGTRGPVQCGFPLFHPPSESPSTGSMGQLSGSVTLA